MEHWIIFGLLTGVFWGIVAIFLYTPFNKLEWKRQPFWIKCRAIFIVINQFVFNFVGGFFGWFCLDKLLIRIQSKEMDGIAVYLLILTILGLSGKLSAIIWEIPSAVKEMFSAIARKVVDKAP